MLPLGNAGRASSPVGNIPRGRAAGADSSHGGRYTAPVLARVPLPAAPRPPMSPAFRFPALQKGLLLFWAIWLSLVVVTNLGDALKVAGVLPAAWTLASYNYTLLAQTVGAHGVPAAVAALLFGGAVLWQALAAGLFWRAFRALCRGRPATSDEVTQAFVVSLAGAPRGARPLLSPGRLRRPASARHRPR